MQIERATHGNLASQMKTLTDENALMKEDLAFFQTLMTSSGDAPGGISINRFRVRADALARGVSLSAAGGAVAHAQP